MIINILLLIPLATLAVTLHELGHASVDKLLGVKVYRVSIGSGRLLFTSNLLGFPFQVHANVLWGGARTIAASPSDRFLRLKRCLGAAAGPGTNLFIAGALYAKFGRLAIWDFNSNRTAPLAVFCFVNAALLIGSLIPRKSARTGIQSDGYRLLTIPFMSPDQMAGYRAAYFELEGAELVRSGHAREAIELYERARSINPTGTGALLGLHAAYFSLRDYGAARDSVKWLLDNVTLPQGRPRSLVLNNIAWVDLMLDDPSLLAEADAYSREAFESNRTHPFYKGTRGAVLVRLGRYDEGISLLAEAYRRHTTSAARGAVAYWAAIGEAYRGNQNDADRWLKNAIDACPDDPLRQRAETEILKATLQPATN